MERLIAEHDVSYRPKAVASPAQRASGVEHLQRTLGNAGVGLALQRDRAEGEEAGATSPVLGVIGRGSGSPLDPDVRSDMEASLGADFSDVRVHTGGSAAESANAVGARAYTVGNEIVFNDGAYAPDSHDGRKTLAHELTHVVQQRSGPVDATPTGDGIAVSDPGDRFEREAVATSERVVARDAAPAVLGPAASVQRDAAPEEDEEADVQMLQRQEDEVPEEEEMPAG